MRNLTSLTSLASSVRPALLALATASLLMACTGDDTNPALPDAGTVSDASADAAKATDGAAVETDSGAATDSGSATDSATETDSAPATDAAADAG